MTDGLLFFAARRLIWLVKCAGESTAALLLLATKKGQGLLWLARSSQNVAQGGCTEGSGVHLHRSAIVPVSEHPSTCASWCPETVAHSQDEALSFAVCCSCGARHVDDHIKVAYSH
jgi:hypothetical protein